MYGLGNAKYPALDFSTQQPCCGGAGKAVHYMNKSSNILVVACGVLGPDLSRLTKEMGENIDLHLLPAGLHETPKILRRELQAAVDGVQTTGKYERIVIGYGICGRGSVGLEARDVPLVLPKVHDCISLFLGGNAAYQKQFSRFPGTYYISAGWYSEKTEPLAQRKRQAYFGEVKLTLEELTEKYGKARARETLDFLNSWQRNYKRAAFINTGSGDPRVLAEYARQMAEEYGWRYEEVAGDLKLLRRLLSARASTDEILVVHTGFRVSFDPRRSGLSAVPLLEKETTNAPKTRTVKLSRPSDSKTGADARLGLGIDAGGTYTDAVIYDLKSQKVLGKSKALTTRWNFAEGIREALLNLEASMLSKVDLTAVSTTLATNAIVEGEGQKVGLLIMPPYGLFKPSDIPYEPKAVISGQLEITGAELSPVDESQVAQVAENMIRTHKVEAFAVSGFAGTVNPAHELIAKRIIREKFGKTVTLGHELSDLLNFRTRALTAVLNARIVPRLARLLSNLETVRQELGVTSPVVVVKGDGTLMSAKLAAERPVETILSGPAASVAGARYLTGQKNAIVVDMGGTTTDTAALEEGRVKICAHGSSVGGSQTHVRALEIRTSGLGGDSYIKLEEGRVVIGPRRVAPMAWMGGRTPLAGRALDYLEKNLDLYAASTAPMQVLMLTGSVPDEELSERQALIVRLLRERPHCPDELARRAGLVSRQVMNLSGLEERFVLQRCGLTPTDILHVRGDFLKWDPEMSLRILGMFSELSGLGQDHLCEQILEEIRDKLARELLKKLIDDQVDPEEMDNCSVCGVFVGAILHKKSRGFKLGMKLDHPVIGIGAPVHFFLPGAARMLGAEAVIPKHSDVANAIGAITSNIVIRRKVVIRPDDKQGFFVEGIKGTPCFVEFDQAVLFAENELRRMVRAGARAAGTSSLEMEITETDQMPSTADGRKLFLSRTLEAVLTGPPDLLPEKGRGPEEKAVNF